MVSPVEASARYLMHLRNAWNHAMAAEAEARRLASEGRAVVWIDSVKKGSMLRQVRGNGTLVPMTVTTYKLICCT